MSVATEAVLLFASLSRTCACALTLPQYHRTSNLTHRRVIAHDHNLIRLRLPLGYCKQLEQGVGWKLTHYSCSS
ncbi:hypothetical protein FA13DRAFT_1171723 [Coprinellus micaceus]|uniref:Secreted protein n=1 Tax=Coprinellus micaceus TaxID=71717 RepID=A0A4Y7RBD8_COPMI|nr:hypothetical protein FA13DRAFT_1171723 [Coprinellus micaceus]